MDIFERLAGRAIERYAPRVRIPDTAGRIIPFATEVVKSFKTGDVTGILPSALNALVPRDSIFSNLLSGGGLGSNFVAGADRPKSLIGGITLDQAREIYNESARTNFAKKNLWYIAIDDMKGGAESPKNVNLFATNVGYSPHTITGDPVQIGSGVADTITGTERVDMRISTMDDERGSIKRWFKDLSLRVAHPDGTFGLPVDYLLRITVIHAFIGEQADGAGNAFIESFVMRPVSIELDKDRRSDELEELQLNFTEFDTFTNLV